MSERLMLALELAWGLIANAGGGDWSKETPEWREAAERWRDQQWHPLLDAQPKASEAPDTPFMCAEYAGCTPTHCCYPGEEHCALRGATGSSTVAPSGREGVATTDRTIRKPTPVIEDFPPVDGTFPDPDALAAKIVAKLKKENGLWPLRLVEDEGAVGVLIARVLREGA